MKDKKQRKKNHWKTAAIILLIVVLLFVANHEYKKYYEIKIKNEYPELTCKYAVNVSEAPCGMIPVICYYTYPTYNPFCEGGGE